MNNTKKDIRWSVTVALMMAIVILLANTPLGMIQLPIIKATTVHIPVIVGAIVGTVICLILCHLLAPSILAASYNSEGTPEIAAT